MNVNAANALLKNLEEPPARTLFLLIAHSLGRLLPTIRSRCQIVRLQPLGDDDLLAALAAPARSRSRPPQAPCWRAPPAARATPSCWPTMAASKSPRRSTGCSARAIPDAAEAHRLADAVGGRDQAIPFGIFNEPCARAALRLPRAMPPSRATSKRPAAISELWHETRDCDHRHGNLQSRPQTACARHDLPALAATCVRM